ncbi:MAG: amidohydrolase family protein [Victivallaceae bacterium]|nr:amidohydrolase family protein [Victivallaceae bacterium]
MFKVPGFIDLQVNGFLGVDFSRGNLSESDFIRVSLELLKHGTAAFLATVITSSEENYRRILPLIAKAMKTPELRGRVLGIHAEGPFLNNRPGAVGAHNPAWVKAPSIEFFKRMQDWADGQIKILTIAAENDGAAELTKYAVSRGVAVSLGHQLASYEDLVKSAAAGATLLTHLGNGMPNEVNRHHNPLWSGLACDALTAMIITDGHHLPPPVIKTVIRAKGLNNIIITSDASPLAGMPPGVYETLGNRAVLETDGLLHNPEKKCLVGSSATMLQCVNYLASLGLLTPEELIRVAFTNPLKAIGINPDFIPTGVNCAWNEAEKQFIPVRT